MKQLRAPFPWFGGKSRAASLVWEGLGDVRHYVEPFAGSLAVMLARPHEPRIETVNDLDAYLANFWRAVTLAPDDVASFADWPVNEADLHARHRWLVDQTNFRERMRSDPDFYDAKIAGWWVWGLSCWIGGGWCATEPHGRNNEVPSEQAKRPRLTHAETGVHRKKLSVDRNAGARPDLTGPRGVHRTSQRRPSTGGSGGGQGVQSPTVTREESGLVEWFHALAARLRRVRVCCGDWKRVLTPAVLKSHGGATGIVIDPPYAHDERADNLYAEESAGVSADVRSWALEHGEDPELRIVLCGYEGEHEMPPNWRVAEWHTSGGYASAERGLENRFRERLWFSPACLDPKQRSLFA